MLTVTGTGFIASSVLNFNGTALTTTYVSATSLTASVPASLLAADGSASISVTNPTPGGGTSTVESYTITVPTPTVTSISPANVTALTADRITVSGSGFEANSQVLWNGTAHATTYVNNSTLQVTLTAADTASGGAVGNITVANPGIDPATPVGLAVLATLPVLSGISPVSVTAGSAATSVTLGGANFQANAIVQAAGQSLAITSLSTTTIVATLPASLIANPGTVSFVVTNPGSPAISSNSATMTVANATSTGTMTVSPSSVPAGSPDTTITLSQYTGPGFAQDSIVTWNGEALATTYVNSQELTAVIPAADLATFVNASVGVITPENATAPAAVPFDTYLALQTNDILYRVTDGLIYASVPGAMGGGLGNTVVGIDPTTGVITRTIFVGSNPNRMALSTDGTQLFVGLDGAGAFVQVDLTSGAVGTPVTLGSGTASGAGANTAAGLAAVPGEANSVAVLSASGGVTIYDAGTPRANASASLTSNFFYTYGALTFGSSASTLYVLPETLSGSLYQLTVDASGVTATTQIGSQAGGVTLQYDNGLLYMSDALVYSPTTGAQVGEFTWPGVFGPTPNVGPLVSDSTLNLAWILPDTYSYNGTVQYELMSYDETTYDQVGSLPIASFTTTPSDLIRWGQDGLAFHTPTQLFVFSGAIVKDNSSTPADVGVTISAPSSGTTGTSLSYTVTVTNNGPNAATGVTSAVTLPGGAIAGTAVASTGSCSGAGVYYCDLGSLASGASATVTVSATPTEAGTLEASASIASVSYDPDAANNQATASVAVTGSTYYAAPVVTQLSPALVQAGASNFTLTVDGENFAPSSTILWNGTALSTTYVSSGQLTANVPASSVNGIGYALVSVQTAASGGGTSAVLPFTVYQLLNVPANAMAYDGFTQKLYAVLPSSSTPIAGNSIVSIDPVTGTAGTPIAVGSEPNLLSETSDGQYFYVGLSGAKSLARFNLGTQAVDLTVPIPGQSTEGAQVAATAIATVPGSDSSLAVQAVGGYGIGIFDIVGSAGTFRQNYTSYNGGAYPIFGDATHFFAYSSTSQDAEFYRYQISSSGASLLDTTALDGFGGYGYAVALDGGLAYASGGGVLNPSTNPPSQVGVLPLGAGLANAASYGAVVPYGTAQKAFAVVATYDTSQGTYLQRFDLRHFTADAQLQLPLGATGTSTGTRWGQDGLAYLLPSQDSSGNPTSQILLLRGPFVLPAEAVANSAPTLSSVSASTITAGSGNQSLTVTGSGFLPGATVTWGGSARTTTWVSATELTVAIPASDVAKSATVTLGSANPGSSASNTLTVTVQ